MEKKLLPTSNGKSDPTANVKDMLWGATTRIDDLREAETRRVNEVMLAESRRVDDSIKAERHRVNEQMSLRAEYGRLLETAEAKRIDAIRAVDVAAVAIANERATAQAAMLATQLVQSDQTSRALVATTAAAMATQLAQITTQLTDRLASLEKAQYEGVGKGRIIDPLMDDLLAEVKLLRNADATTKGKSRGMGDMWGWVIGGIAVLLSLYSFLSRLQ